jgi:hypothetical protein
MVPSAQSRGILRPEAQRDGRRARAPVQSTQLDLADALSRQVGHCSDLFQGHRSALSKVKGTTSIGRHLPRIEMREVEDDRSRLGDIEVERMFASGEYAGPRVLDHFDKPMTTRETSFSVFLVRNAALR